MKSFAGNDKFGKYIKLKSFCATRWTCRLEAVKSVHCQILRILLALKQCSNEKDSKTSVDALGLFVAVCDFQFQVLKFIFSFTNPLATYLQGKEIDTATAQKKTALGTIANIKDHRNMENL